MEHFDEKPGIREKSLYTFHLDTPRIVIAVSVFLGVVALTFLLGMAFTRGDKTNPEKLTAGDLLASGKHDLNGFDQGLAAQNAPADISQPNINSPQIKSPDAGSALLPSNRLGNDNDLFPSDKEPALDGIFANNSSKREKNIEKNKDKREVKNKNKTIGKENIASNSRGVRKDTAKRKSSVVSVVNEFKNPAKGFFAVQVASYDKRSKAANEIENLKKLNYNAYMNDTLIDGRQFFRVRIGPLSSKEKAVAIMDEIQDNDRYASSYIVKE